MKMKKIFFYALSVLFLVSCSKSDDPFVEGKPKYNYSNGILFVNEGNFGLSNASIGFSNFDYSNVKSNIYNNAERTIGDVAQSMGFFEDKAFIVVNNSDKIEVVHRYSFENIATITEHINHPRYTATSNGKLYVTNAESQSVTIYDLKNFEFLKEIKLNSPVEYIVAERNKVYVQQAAYGEGNQLAVIDNESDEVIKTLEFQDSLQGLVAHAGFIYVISSIDSRSNFYKINASDDTIHIEFTSTKVPNARHLTLDDNLLYFTSNNNIHTWETTATNVNYTPIFSIKNTGGYGFMYGFGVIDHKVIISEAGDFTSPSQISVYAFDNYEGQWLLKHSFKGEIGTSAFYKN